MFSHGYTTFNTYITCPYLTKFKTIPCITFRHKHIPIGFSSVKYLSFSSIKDLFPVNTQIRRNQSVIYMDSEETDLFFDETQLQSKSVKID